MKFDGFMLSQIETKNMECKFSKTNSKNKVKEKLIGQKIRKR